MIVTFTYIFWVKYCKFYYVHIQKHFAIKKSSSALKKLRLIYLYVPTKVFGNFLFDFQKVSTFPRQKCDYGPRDQCIN